MKTPSPHPLPATVTVGLKTFGRLARLAASVLLLPVLAAGLLSAKPTVVAPFAGSPDYITKGVIIGAKVGPHRAISTARFNGTPAMASRPLSVNPDSSFNGELVRNHAPRLGPRALPDVFGGFSAIVYDMKEPTSFTARAQFHDSPTGRTDFLNLHFYLENSQPQPAGFEFSFTGALLFRAGEGGSSRIVPAEKISYVSFQVASQRPFTRFIRVLVRDADSGDFFVSDAFSNENTASISLAGSKWAKLDSANLTLLGEYLPATFQRIDHIGVYATVPVTTITDTLPVYGVICNVALHSFEYALAP